MLLQFFAPLTLIPCFRAFMELRIHFSSRVNTLLDRSILKMTHCETTRVTKSIRRQSQQICLKLFILIVSCSTLCLVCFCVESYRQNSLMEHSSEKLTQYKENLERESPWIEPVEESRKIRSKELFFQEGSGAEATSAEIENGWSKKEDNLENLYTTAVDENFNVWKDSSNPKDEDVFVAKETIGLEEYIAQHKPQTIDTSAEQVTTTQKSTTELCQHEESENETTANTEKPFVEFNAPISEEVDNFSTTAKPSVFNSDTLSEEEVSNMHYHSESQSERFGEMLKSEEPYIEHHIVATPPRPIKSVESYSQPQVWFTDDYEDFEKFIAQAENENHAQLQHFTEPKEIIASYKPQPTIDYEEYDTDYDTHSMLLPDEQTPRFIEQLLGNLNRMSHMFAPLPAPTLRPAYSRNNHLHNFHQTYEDADQQYFASNHHKKIKHKHSRPNKLNKQYYDEDMELASSDWYRKKPSKDMMDAMKLLKALFEKHVIE